MSDSTVNAILFCVVVYFVTRSTVLSLEFLERIRARQVKQRDKAEGTDKRAAYVETEKGYLLDEKGEPAEFLIDKHKTFCSGRIAHARAQRMVDNIDRGGMGLIYPTTMVSYYRSIPTLKPIR